MCSKNILNENEHLKNHREAEASDDLKTKPNQEKTENTNTTNNTSILQPVQNYSQVIPSNYNNEQSQVLHAKNQYISQNGNEEVNVTNTNITNSNTEVKDNNSNNNEVNANIVDNRKENDNSINNNKIENGGLNNNNFININEFDDDISKAIAQSLETQKYEESKHSLMPEYYDENNRLNYEKIIQQENNIREEIEKNSPLVSEVHCMDHLIKEFADSIFEQTIQNDIIPKYGGVRLIRRDGIYLI